MVQRVHLVFICVARGWRDGLVGKTCSQAWRPEFDPNTHVKKPGTATVHICAPRKRKVGTKTIRS